MNVRYSRETLDARPFYDRVVDRKRIKIKRKNVCMLNKKDFLKYASKLAFPIMIQNLIGTLVNIADTVMLGYVSQTAMSASSLANQYTFILFCLYYGMATGTSVLCAQYWERVIKRQ